MPLNKYSVSLHWYSVIDKLISYAYILQSAIHHQNKLLSSAIKIEQLSSQFNLLSI